jgi:hypothetical protein
MYRFWRSLDNLPRIINYFDSVQAINDRLSHWTVKRLPGSRRLEVTAGVDVDNTGSVEFNPQANGKRTWLTVTLQYELPGGKLGSAIAKWFGEDPKIQLAEDLQRLKEQMETGVVSRAGDREESTKARAMKSVLTTYRIHRWESVGPRDREAETPAVLPDDHEIMSARTFFKYQGYHQFIRLEI